MIGSNGSIGIGMIGCGGMGRSLVRRVLRQDARLRVIALLDPDSRSIAQAREELPEEPLVCESLEALLGMPDLQWVMIASWNCQHAEQAIRAMEAGKAVFCQKPLAIGLEEALEVAKVWRRTGCSFTTGFTLRYSPHYRTIRRCVAEGRLGELISMEFNETLDFNHGGYIMGDWRRWQANAGSHLLEKCCHDIDLANWMVGARASRVASFGGLRFFTPENAHHIERIGNSPEGKPAYQTWKGLVKVNPFTDGKDIVDHQVAILEYANGVCATFHTNLNAGIPERRMVLLGTEGALRADLVTGRIEFKPIGFGTAIEELGSTDRGAHGGGDEVLARELADSMLEGAEPAAGLREALESAVTCFAVDAAMESGRVFDLAEDWARVDAVMAPAEMS